MLVFLVHLFGLCLIISVLMLAAVVAYYYFKTPKEPRSVEVLEAKLEHCYEHSLGKMDFLKRWLLLSELIRAQTKAMGSDDSLLGALALPGGRVAGPQVVKLLDARECYRRAREKAIASRGGNAWRDDPTVVHCVDSKHWFGWSPPNFRTLYLGQIEVDSADFWTNRLLSSSSRSTAKESGPNRLITRTLKSG